jgi:hypothetical protein
MRAATARIAMQLGQSAVAEFAAALLLGAVFFAPSCAADDEVFAVHGQFTYVEESTSDFNAPYRGTNSLSPD